jgi:hypothetical protein
MLLLLTTCAPIICYKGELLKHIQCCFQAAVLDSMKHPMHFALTSISCCETELGGIRHHRLSDLFIIYVVCAALYGQPHVRDLLKWTWVIAAESCKFSIYTAVRKLLPLASTGPILHSSLFIGRAHTEDTKRQSDRYLSP